ncbi:MAG: 50S ribosomal protein L11 methyltransferase [Bacteroidetes bacterium]|nr:50S ribosomal protein L11 methyltransferase [Bacteroidota bacterium]
MQITKQTILRRNHRVLIRIQAAHAVLIVVDGMEQSFPNHALTILDVFTHPQTFEEGLKKINTSGARNWIELTTTIQQLWTFGALIGDKQQSFADKQWRSFGASHIHIKMLNDYVRTTFFIDTLDQITGSEDVVLDIGTGTGVLAIAAARAGAKKVYAIEAGTMADIAEKIIKNTEVADKIEVIRGWSTDITLPEKADILVSEIIGDDPFGEMILPTFIDARARLLKPSAKIIPGYMKVFLLPVQMPESTIQNRIVQTIQLDKWKKWYNIDFSMLNDLKVDYSENFITANRDQAQQFEIKGEPILIADIDFSQQASTNLHQQLNLSTESVFNSFLMYFEIHSGTYKLSTHPTTSSTSNHWRNPVWYSPEAEKLKIGDAYSLSYDYTESKGSILTINRL